MTRSSFAPELSATFTRVSCWTIRLLGLLHDLEHPPALLLGEGARLGDADEVAHAALVLLVVDLEARPLADCLAVQAVGLGRPDLDDDGLVHLVGDDGAETNLAPAADLRGGRGCVAHSASFLRPPPGFGARRPSSLASRLGGADHSRLHRQLGRRELHRLLSDLRRDTAHLEQHATRLDHRHPALGVALAGAHAGLGRLLGDRLVGEDADPDLAAALDVAGHGAAGSLDLPVRHPRGLHRLQAEVAERDGGALRGDALAAAAVHLAVLDALGDQHQLSAFFVFFTPPAFLTSDGVVFARTAVFLSSVRASAFGLGAAFGLAGAAFFSSTLAVAVRVRRGVAAGTASGAGTSTATAVGSGRASMISAWGVSGSGGLGTGCSSVTGARRRCAGVIWSL